MSDLESRAVGTGIALGAGVGATTGLLANGSTALGIGYGVAVGIVVGSILARLAPRLASLAHPRLVLVGCGLVLGLAVGGLVGLGAAWGDDAALLTGAGAGGAGGAALGVLVSGVLATSLEDERSPGENATAGDRR